MKKEELISSKAYLNVGTFPMTIGPEGKRKGGRDRTFHTYLELYEQGKHDRKVHGYVLDKVKDLKVRKTDGTQVLYKEKLEDFYRARGQTIANRVAKKLDDGWNKQAKGDDPLFALDAKAEMSIQKERQPDGYSYEASYWYAGKDIYVAFHCYPSR